MNSISTASNPYSYTTKEASRNVKVDAPSAATKTDGRIFGTKDSVDISHEGQEARDKIDAMRKNVMSPEQLKEWAFEKARQSITPLSLEELRKEYELQNGVKIGDGTSCASGSANGLFSGSTNSYSSLGRMLGMKGQFFDKTSFLNSLNNQIAGESKALTKDLNAVLKKAGLGDVTKKITFSEDAKGDIVVEGNISTKQKKQIARLVNADPGLAERIKTQKARMEIATEMQNDEPDLSDEKFDAARTQILKDYFDKNGISLDRIQVEETEPGIKNFFLKNDRGNQEFNETFREAMDSCPGLGQEVQAHMERANVTKTRSVAPPTGNRTAKNDDPAVRPLLSMKRGALSEATDEEPDFGSQIRSLRESISDTIVAEINEIYKNEPDLQIRDYTIKIDGEGRISITDVKTQGNDPEANLRAASMMNGKINAETRDWAKVLGKDILNAHDDEHGDVAEYKHDVIIGSGANGGYKIESREADEAAMREIQSLTGDISSFLGDFFGKTQDIDQPFSLVFDFNSFSLSDAGSLSQKDTAAVKQVLEDFNKFLANEDTGDDLDAELPAKYSGIGDKLIALKEAKGKLHDPSLLPKGGIRFAFA